MTVKSQQYDNWTKDKAIFFLERLFVENVGYDSRLS
jgi:hypothetical protein